MKSYVRLPIVNQLVSTFRLEARFQHAPASEAETETEPDSASLYESAQKDINSLEHKLDAYIHEEADSKERNQAQIPALAAELDSLAQKVSVLSKQNTLSTITQFRELEEENTDLHQQVADLSEHCEALNEDIQVLTHEDRSKSQRLRAIEEDALQRQGRFEADKAELLRRLEGAQTFEGLNSEMQSQLLEEAKRTIHALNKRAVESSQAQEQAQATQESAKGTMARLETRLSEAEGERDKHKHAIEGYKSKLEELGAQLDALRETTQHQLVTASQAESDKLATATQMASLQALLEEVQTDKAGLEATLQRGQMASLKEGTRARCRAWRSAWRRRRSCRRTATSFRRGDGHDAVTATDAR